MTFIDYILEGVSPSKTSYGTDLENKEFNVNMGVIYTFFKSKDYFYYVAYSQLTNEFSFGISNEFSKNINDYDNDGKYSTNAIKIFSNVLYIFLEMIKQFKNINCVKFLAANNSLRAIYDKLTTNKIFLRTLKANNFEFTKREGEFFIYNKIKT